MSKKRGAEEMSSSDQTAAGAALSEQAVNPSDDILNPFHQLESAKSDEAEGAEPADVTKEMEELEQQVKELQKTALASGGATPAISQEALQGALEIISKLGGQKTGAEGTSDTAADTNALSLRSLTANALAAAGRMPALGNLDVGTDKALLLSLASIIKDSRLQDPAGADAVTDKTTRKRRKKTTQQMTVLREFYAGESRPSKQALRNIGHSVGLSYDEVCRWFRNERHKMKRFQVSANSVEGGVVAPAGAASSGQQANNQEAVVRRDNYGNAITAAGGPAAGLLPGSGGMTHANAARLMTLMSCSDLNSAEVVAAVAAATQAAGADASALTAFDIQRLLPDVASAASSSSSPSLLSSSSSSSSTDASASLFTINASAVSSSDAPAASADSSSSSSSSEEGKESAVP